jgi:hypothetical protein
MKNKIIYASAAVVLIVALIFVMTSCSADTKGIVIDKFHEVISDEYRLYVRTESGDRYFIVDKRTFNDSQIGKEVDLSGYSQR